ncbi:reductive dehalogenase [Dehalogenimonas formicexedens]|uniref:Reductive dehalogenase n=2 Tax=Dehalogenimonas TaxID=670486 RepID=A0A1P8FA40_9CHLR|nr:MULTISPECIES: reductive dehalogenase [Dehalogenimonas]APV45314.1 reductive dehalogenase [Dehalogenimonas formicexedens]KTB49119.1 reductive dehalogenase [Dehalogenimonas alkenigignens]
MTKYHVTHTEKAFTTHFDLPSHVFQQSIASDTFHDLDEVLASQLAKNQRPWWVSPLEINHPTCEINWENIHRFDGRESLHTIHSLAKYIGGIQAVYDSINSGHRALLSEIRHSRLTLFRQALIEGSRIKPYFAKTFLGREHAETSSAYREPITWQGTPEENLGILTAAARYFGAYTIGTMELNSLERKLLFTYPRGNNNPPAKYGKTKATTNDFTHDWPPPNDIIKPIVFEDVTRAYESANRYVIPKKKLWIVSIMMPPIRSTHENSSIWGPRYYDNSYRTHTAVQTCLQDFLRAIGYQGMGYMDDTQGLLPAAAAAILSGLAEVTRNNNYCFCPKPQNNSSYFSMITDLPLAPTGPIDSGVFRYCHTCFKCATVCPSGAISNHSEASWEPPTFEGMSNEYTVPGKKLFFNKTHLCKKHSLEQSSECNLCLATCPFCSSLLNIPRSF